MAIGRCNAGPMRGLLNPLLGQRASSNGGSHGGSLRAVRA